MPVLLPDDLCWRGESHDGETPRRDLATWFSHCFEIPTLTFSAWQHAYAVLLDVINERLSEPYASLWEFLEAVEAYRSPSWAWQAACWNEMLVRLGYTLDDEYRTDPGID